MMTDHYVGMDPERLPLELCRVLVEHSPRLIITKPTLVRFPGSPSGWLLVLPEHLKLYGMP